MFSTHWIAGGAVLLCCLAAYWDLRHRRVPNALTLPAVGIALALHGATHSGQGLLLSLAGALAAAAPVLPGFVMGFTGGGDVKLLLAVGAFLAFPAALYVALLSLILGGLLSITVAMRGRAAGGLLRRSTGLAKAVAFRAAGAPLQPAEAPRRTIPLGVAIALATVLFVLSR